MEPGSGDERRGERLGWKAPAVALALYLAAIAAATWPMAEKAARELPGAFYDSSQHLWVMRWYRTCLKEGASAVICPEIQYPVGAPMGNFSPLHLQAAMYLLISLVCTNDVLNFNLIWWAGLLLTGMGTFALVWHTLRDRACATFGGLAAMLSAPVLLHARAPHLELVFLGGVPLFLLAWVRFVDRPGRGALLAAAGAYVLAALGAAYYAVLAAVPAALYVGMGAARAAKDRDVAWLRSRLRWMLAFGAVSGPLLLGVFGNTAWSMAAGYSGPRTLAEFQVFRAPVWSYWTPTSAHRLGHLMPVDLYGISGFADRIHESGSYLGVATLLLMHYAAVRRARCARAGYWWAVVVLMVVLSLGAYAEIGARRIPLPGGWLKQHVFLFRMIRAPARFNLIAAVAATVLASAGLKDLLARLPRAWMRGPAVVALMLFAVADLSLAPYPSGPPAPMPACYAYLDRVAPGAAILEAPQSPSQGDLLSSACGFWQASHRHPTTAGYSGGANAPFDALISFPSPFDAYRLGDPNYLEHPEDESYDVFPRGGFRETAWLFLKAHRLPYVVLHRRPGMAWRPVRLDRIEALMAGAKVYEDADAIIYESARLDPPARPTLLCGDGWRLGERDGRRFRVLPGRATLHAYNPDAARELSFTLTGSSVREPRALVLRDGRGTELARWHVRPGAAATYTSPPFRLPAGAQGLTLECDGQVKPSRGHEMAADGDRRPYSLRISAMGLAAAPE